MQILTFVIQEESFAIGIDLVETIENIGRITPIPKSKESIIGLISSRGSVIPVINTGILVGKNEANHEFQKLIITNVRNEKLALAVDDIDDVIEVDDTDIETLGLDDRISVVKTNSSIMTVLNKEQLERI